MGGWRPSGDTHPQLWPWARHSPSWGHQIRSNKSRQAHKAIQPADTAACSLDGNSTYASKVRGTHHLTPGQVLHFRSAPNRAACPTPPATSCRPHSQLPTTDVPTGTPAWKASGATKIGHEDLNRPGCGYVSALTGPCPPPRPHLGASAHPPVISWDLLLRGQSHLGTSFQGPLTAGPQGPPCPSAPWTVSSSPSIMKEPEGTVAL